MENETFNLEDLIQLQDSEVPLDEKIEVEEEPQSEPEEEEVIEEEEEEEEQQPKDKPEEKKEEEEEEEPSALPEPTNKLGEDYRPQFELLQKTGYIDTPEDFVFDGSADSLEEALKITEAAKAKGYIESYQSEFLSRIPDEGKALLKYFIEGGKDVSKYLDTYSPVTSVPLEDLDITNPTTQKNIMKEYYKKTSSYTDEKIDKLISRLERSDSLQEDAEETLEELKQIEVAEREALVLEERNQKIRDEKAQEEQRNLLSSTIDETELIPKDRKSKVKAFLFNQISSSDGKTTTSYAKSLNSIFSNPEHLTQLADILLDYKPKEGFNLSRFEKKGKTKANSNFRAILEKAADPKTKQFGSSATSLLGKPDIDMEDILKQMG